MQQHQFIEILKQPERLTPSHLSDLEKILIAYPFFESAHLLYAKALQQFQPVNYSLQLRKTAIIANKRGVLFELLHRQAVEQFPVPVIENQILDEKKPETDHVNTVTVTNSDVKVIYVNTVPNTKDKESIDEGPIKESKNAEIEIVKSIENTTEPPKENFDVEKLNKTIEQDISQGIIESYVQTDILNIPGLNKEEVKEPSSFTDWLKVIQKEAPTFQKPSQKDNKPEKLIENTAKSVEKEKKSTVFEQKKQLIDKIIESDPGRIKLGTNKFFTPATDAKQSLLENEHLVTETLAKIYALQGNISKAIRAYEILSLKFPQKSVYFASLIEKLKTNK